MIHAPVGRRTVGKTTLADFLCSNCDYQARFSPRITLPARGRQIRDMWKGGSAVVEQDIANTLTRGECITLVPDEDVDGNFGKFAQCIRRWYQDNEARCITEQKQLGLLVDEARFSAVRQSPDLDWLFRCTQRDLVHVYLTVHRPKDLDPDIRAVVDHWYVFHVTQPRDLDVIAEECLPVVAELCARLPPREFVAFDASTQKHRHWKASESNIWKPTTDPLHREPVKGASDRFFEGANESGPNIRLF